jgi:FtsZ-binding cell division protein ZapB
LDQQIVPLVSIFIAVLSLSIVVVGLRRKTNDSYTATLERRIEELKGEQTMMQRDLDDCKRARDAFEDKNFTLLQEVYDLRKKMDTGRNDPGRP